MSYIPLSLYIHMPWCISKCPYCDFNSHGLRGELPELRYIEALLEDLKQKLDWVQDRPIYSIFIGGGTPSLLSAAAYQRLFDGLHRALNIPAGTEITMEANPGTVEQARFTEYREIGINRLSLGIQSFDDEKLKTLGRIHGGAEAIRAVHTAKQAGFGNMNVDLMYGLPNQSIEQTLQDLKIAAELQTNHLSWYQLTLEPNTFFYKHPPRLPEDDLIWDMQLQGQRLLVEQGFNQYEISAYSRGDHMCLHNVNYWEFGDYLGIGAGAHGKITDLKTGKIQRHSNIKSPKEYLNPERAFVEMVNTVVDEELPLEFMMNVLRLQRVIPLSLFVERTGLSLQLLLNPLQTAIQKGLLKIENENIIVTEIGRRFLNDLLEIFLTNTKSITLD